MLQRVTSRTQNHQVFFFVIIFISILMVNAQNDWFFFIPTFLAFFNKTSFQHCLSNSGINRVPLSGDALVHTLYRAIFSVMASMANEFFFTMKAFIGLFSFQSLRFSIAFSRTVFCFIAPRRYMGKLMPAYFAIRGNLFSFIQALTFKGTEFRDLEPIGLNKIRCITF